MKQLERMESGIEGLDALLRGGFVRGACYLIQGRPGSGKTILATQIAFNHLAQGGRAIFSTLLSESHDRMFSFLSTQSFFERERVGREIQYLSAFDTLERDGLEAVIRLLRQEILRHKASLLVVDGLLNARGRAETPLDTKKFIAELQAHAAFCGCTVLFLTSAAIDEGSPELTMVDGMLTLDEQAAGVRSIRRIGVRKSRGSAAIGGEHEFAIGDDGIVVHPRLEALLNKGARALNLSNQRLSSGVESFDEMLCGGLPEASISLVMGPSGCGKTTLGLNFISSATADAPGLLLSFYETAEELQLKADSFGLPLRQLCEEGVVRIEWMPSTELKLDEVGARLLQHIRVSGARRVLIDSLGALTRAAEAQGRLIEYFCALMNELRALGVCVQATWELSELFGTSISSPLCSVFDNLLLMRYVERQGEFKRTLTILKLRNSRFDPAPHEVDIGAGGVVLQRLAGPGASASPGAG